MTSKDSSPLWYDAWATAWGPVGAVAGPKGLKRFVLPGHQLDELLELLAWEHRGAARDAEPFGGLVQLSKDYFNGRRVDFGPVTCDLPGEGSFSGKVYRACRGVPYGETMSYSALAWQIGSQDAARAVATAMSKNQIALVVPCHRVIYADGRAGGFSAPGGPELKQRMLKLEGRAPGDNSAGPAAQRPRAGGESP